MMKRNALVLLLSVVTLSVQAASVASPDKKVERIEVYGYKHLTLYKKEWDTKRFAFMDFFNERVDDPDLKFDCRKSRNAERNTRIKKKVCRNAYDWRIRQEQFGENFVIRGGGFVESQAFAEIGTSELEDRQSDKIEAIQEMLTEYPEFNEIYTDLKDAEHKYKEAHKRTFGSFSNGAKEEAVSSK